MNKESNIQNEKKEIPSILDPQKQLEMFSKGKMNLTTPIRSGGKDVGCLIFDFSALTGRELVAALDKDRSSGVNAFRITSAQAFNLFAAAAGKATEGIDETDILERMGAIDSVKAVQLATVFFSAANRVGNKGISNA